MKMPQKPPGVSHLLDGNPDEALLRRLFNPELGVGPNGKYVHWDKLRHHPPPQGISHTEWWEAIKWQRMNLYKPIPLADLEGKSFVYAQVDPIPERLHEFDQGLAGQIRMPKQVTAETRDQYRVSSLIEEAITSSQLEGATTTREVAKTMIRANRPARDRSEQMILNNYYTMQHVRTLTDQKLTPEMICNLHRLITDKAMDDPDASGHFRTPDRPIVVSSMLGETLHTPPPASELEARVEALCLFANGKTPEGFLHPVLRSIIVHFWLAYIHPFVDGNGRTARALFYWSMLRQEYWLFEFVSISKIILKGPAKYGRAFLYTETDDNDLTYFILYHLGVIRRALEQLNEYIARKSRQLQRVDALLRSSVALNHRQRALVSHALRNPYFRYTFKSHQTSHRIAYETARGDLYGLQELGLLVSTHSGKAMNFTAVEGLDKKLSTLA